MHATHNDLLALLSHHVGRDNGLSAHRIAQALGILERHVRRGISELREAGTAVCGHPGTGYYIAACAEEIEETCQFLRGRALHSPHLESRLRNIPLPDLLGQLHLPT